MSRLRWVKAIQGWMMQRMHIKPAGSFASFEKPNFHNNLLEQCYIECMSECMSECIKHASDADLDVDCPFNGPEGQAVQ